MNINKGGCILLIGILCKENEKGFAREFFELFKTPWEFYVEGKMYNVVLSTENRIPQVNTNLTIIYSHAEIQNELSCGINRKVKYHGDIVFNNYFEIPIYGDLCTFEGEDQSLLKIKRNSESAGVRIHFSNSFLISLRVPRTGRHSVELLRDCREIAFVG
jgi:hypothetical protein